jgi:hypothetical protein
MIKAAEADLGLGEPNYIQNWYEVKAGTGEWGNFAWCNAAVTWWASKSGNFNEVNHGTYYAYTVAHANRFAQHGEWHVGASGIRRGDIVFFDWNGTNSRGAIDHVGVVTGTTGAAVYTIEGNIGNVCARKVRYENTIAGYGRPRYVTVPTSPPLPTVSIAVTQFALTHRASQEPPSGRGDLTRLQDALVKVGKLRAGEYATGVGDVRTKNAYQSYQESLGYSGADADGIPGITSLTKLGATTKLFRVIP